MASEMYELWKQHSSFMPNQYYKYITSAAAPTAATGYDQRIVNASNVTAGADLATFVFGEDLRKAHSSGALDGVDLTVTANHFLEMNLLTGPSNVQTVYFTGFFDIIFEVDMESGTVAYRM